MRQDIREEAVDRFSQQARAFCAWARGDGGASLDMRSALLQITSLYHAALLLPNPWKENLSSGPTGVDVPKEEVEAVVRRVGELPCQYYSEIYDPFEEVSDPVIGHITDDIGDIYRDVAVGLILFDRGQSDEALWAWGFNLRIHWGEHATSAIRALHAYLSQQSPDCLSDTV